MTNFYYGSTRRPSSHSRDCLCDGCISTFVTHNKDGMCECWFCSDQRCYAHIRNAKLRAALDEYMQMVKSRFPNLAAWPEWYTDYKVASTSFAPKVHRHNAKCKFGEDCNHDEYVNYRHGNYDPDVRKNYLQKEGRQMASINLCDRHKCGAMSKNNVMGMLILIPDVSGPEKIYADAVHTNDRNTRRLEICPGCVGELVDWIDQTPAHEPNGKGYTEAWKPAPKATADRINDIIEKLGSQELMRLALEASDKEAGVTDLD